VGDVGQAEEGAVPAIGAGLGSDGDVLLRVGVEGCVLAGWFGWRGLFVVGEGWEGERGKSDRAKERFAGNCAGPVGLHEQVDYHLRWRTR
jgi:hypothetical protein